MIKKFLKDYFTFTRSERNGLLVLLSLIVVLIILRFTIPHLVKKRSYDFTSFEEEMSEFEKSMDESVSKNENTEPVVLSSTLFEFDPNIATVEELADLGLNDRVIKNILKYREKGGRFIQKEDLKKIYGLDLSVYEQLESFINISGNSEVQPIPAMVEKSSEYIVSLNQADTSDLVQLQGIGPVLSLRIIKYRELLGGYVRKDQLLEVYGIKPETYEAIEEYVTADSLNIRKINLNTTDESTLSRHPYLNAYQSRAILNYRKIKGEIKTIQEIQDNNLLPSEVWNKIHPYLSLD